MLILILTHSGRDTDISVTLRPPHPPGICLTPPKLVWKASGVLGPRLVALFCTFSNGTLVSVNLNLPVIYYFWGQHLATPAAGAGRIVLKTFQSVDFVLDSFSIMLLFKTVSLLSGFSLALDSPIQKFPASFPFYSPPVSSCMLPVFIVVFYAF